MALLNRLYSICLSLNKSPFTAKFLSFQTEVSFDDIKNAMSFKIKHKSLSIPDVVGYMVALRLQVKFLTGDEGFRNLPQVEFVKK